MIPVDSNVRARTRRPAFILCWPAIIVASLDIAADAAPRRPSVVVFLSDDQGWGDFSVSGNTNLATPHIDSLARDGALFDRFYVCPVCSPTRAEFLTGRYHPRSNVFSTSTGGERLDLDEITIADVFRRAGYASAAFGKWHNGSQWPYHPRARGFDEYYGFTSGHWGDYFDPPLEHDGRIVRGKGFIIDDLTDHAMTFIERNRERPFFCYVPYNTPHSPMQVPDRFYEKFRDAELPLRGEAALAANPKTIKAKGRPAKTTEDLAHTRAALAMCENLDWNVGRVLAQLDKLKLADDTIVVYFCDNGPNAIRWNGGMKGRKASTDEGGVRSPLFLRFPRVVKPGTLVRPIAGAIDLLPTLADLCDIKTDGLAKPLDGRNLKPLLSADVADWPERMIFSHWNGKVSVRTDGYRLDAEGRLFDMRADPGQRRDATAEHPAEARRLTAAAGSWRSEVLAELTKQERPFPVGYREFPTTYLPARDGVPHGRIERSATAPNCSYFTNWTSTEDRITWNVDVETAGRYEATVYYTCAKDDVGVELELAVGEARTGATVVEAFDPPIRGAEHDRVLRDHESLVKDFKPLALGEVTLPRGAGELSLRAPKIPGRRAVDVRLLVLTLKP